MKISFFGLGIMGSRMAKRLSMNGYEVFSVLHSNRNSPGIIDFVRSGGNIVDDYGTALKGSKHIISILSDDDAVREFFSRDEVYDGISEGSVIIECTSCSSNVIRELVKAYGKKNVDIFDAPVSGGAIGAENGTLTLMCSGKKEVYEDIMPILEVLGKNIELLSLNPGDGKDIKAINQMLVASHKASAAEAILIANKMGLDIETVKNTICRSSGNHFMLDYDFYKMFKSEDPEVIFTLANMTKDLNIAYDLSEGLNLPVLKALHDKYNVANSEFGNGNFTSIWKAYKK